MSKSIRNFSILCSNEVRISTGSEMRGTTVAVCSGGSRCTQCGDATSVASGGQWATFTCDPPITGNQVKVIQNSDYLAFCEVEIRGESS